MSDNKFTMHSIEIDAAIDEVWDALVNPEITPLYMYGCIPVSDWAVGSSLIWRGLADGVDYVSGSIVTIQPPQELAFTVFDPNGKYADTPENYLTSEYRLSENDGVTTVHVRQGDYSLVEEGDERFKESQAGWEMALQGLKKAVEEQA